MQNDPELDAFLEAYKAFKTAVAGDDAEEHELRTRDLRDRFDALIGEEGCP